jgi:hypothetical protein
LVPNSSQNCTPKYYTKLARLPSGQSDTKGRKTKKLKEKVLNSFAKSLSSGQTWQHRKENKEFKKPRQGEKPVTQNLCKE